MIIQEMTGNPDTGRLIPLISGEWADMFGNYTVHENSASKEMAASWEKSLNFYGDTTRYLADGEEILGFYRFSLWPRDNLLSTGAHILDFTILPEKRRQGLGTLMMEDLFASCKKMGVETLVSRSFAGRDQSIAFHEKAGFLVKLKTERLIIWEKFLK